MESDGEKRYKKKTLLRKGQHHVYRRVRKETQIKRKDDAKKIYQWESLNQKGRNLPGGGGIPQLRQRKGLRLTQKKPRACDTDYSKRKNMGKPEGLKVQFPAKRRIRHEMIKERQRSRHFDSRRNPFNHSSSNDSPNRKEVIRNNEVEDRKC